MSETQDIRLVVQLSNTRPIELLDLTNSLISLGVQFNRYASKNGKGKEERKATLYVKEVKAGSVIFELVELATAGMIPFAENVNTIVGFAGYIKGLFDFFLKREVQEPDLSVKDCKDVHHIVNAVVKDPGSNLSFSVTVNGNVNINHYHINSDEGKSIQKGALNKIIQLEAVNGSGELQEKVLLTFFQARNKPQSKAGNMAVIDEIEKKPMRVHFENEDIKKRMLHGDHNPFNMGFIVDVKLQTAHGNLVAYQVIALHEQFELPVP